MKGWKEMKSLAKTYESIFPKLVAKKYSAEDFHFHYTDKERTESSLKAFATGLFNDDNVNIKDIASPNTNLLKVSYNWHT